MFNALLKKFLFFRVHSFVSAVILISIFLFSAYQVNVKAMGFKVIAGRLTNKFSKSDSCSIYQYNYCQICSLCGCGNHDQYTINPEFGRTAESADKLCDLGYSPMGNKQFDNGVGVFGLCTSDYVQTWDAKSCNIWTF